MFLTISVVVVIVTLAVGKMIGLTRLAAITTKLKLRGLPVNTAPEDGIYRCPIQVTTETLIKNGLDHEIAPRLISRLEWWKQISRYLDTLVETPESIKSVATSLEVLLAYYHLHRSEVEEDLVRSLFQRALQEPELCNLFVKLFKRISSNAGDRSQELITHFFQLAVAEFNKSLSHVEDLEKKINSIKLMAVAFRRRIVGVPDEWLTDCASTLLQRLQARLPQSTEQMCIFLKTLLINECDDDCNLLPSQQQQLMVCFEALQEAALISKAKRGEPSPKLEAKPNTELHQVQPGSQPDTQPGTGKDKSGENFAEAKPTTEEPEPAEIQPAPKTAETSFLANTGAVPKKNRFSDSDLIIHERVPWYDHFGEDYSIPSTSGAGRAALPADDVMVIDEKQVGGLGNAKMPEVMEIPIIKIGTSGSDAVRSRQKPYRRQTRNVQWIFPTSRV